MGRKGLSVFVAILLLSGIFLVIDVTMDITPTTKATTLYVDDSGGQEYSKIQDAIDNASDGYTIFVYSGIYYEHVYINMIDSLILTGENRDTTIIDGSGDGIIINTDSSIGAIIKDFTIRNGDRGIRCHGGAHNLTNNRIQFINISGVELWGVEGDNNVFNNITGLLRFAGLI
jgi:hypothetical protein